MKTHRLFIFVLFIFIAILTAACEFSASTANIKEAYMARSVNEEPEKTTVFPQDEPFYCIVDLANAPDDTTLSASWYAVDAEGVDNNFLIDKVEFTHGSGEITFDLANDGLWPVGTYKVDLYLNEELKQSFEFEVQ